MDSNKKENPFSFSLKYTDEDLHKMQSLPLERKILITQTRIVEWYQKNDGMVYVSFSGGKDSTVLLDIVRKIYSDVPAVFCDTGLEFPEIRQFVKTFDNVTFLKPKMNFRQVIEKYGYPIISKDVAQKIYEYRKKPDGCRKKYFDDNSEYNKKYKGKFSLARWKWLRDTDIPISHMCCMVMKKRPAKQYEKESNRKPMLATMACDSSPRKTAWLRYGCNAFEAKRPVSTPMAFWTENDVLEYIKMYDIPYASVYGDIVKDESSRGGLRTTGCHRTGCVFCGFGCHLEKQPNRFQMLKQTHPMLWEYCMKPWEEGGLGMQSVLECIGVSVQ